MKNSFYKTKGFWISVAVCALPIVLGGFLYNKLPDKVATHFDMNFKPDDYSPKWQAVFVIPTFMLLLNAFMWFIFEADPKKAAINGKMKSIARGLIPVISCFMQGAILLNAVDENTNLIRFIPLVIGLLMIVVGNYMPKCKQNYTMGIKLPWTLASEENWNRTHRLAGKLFIIAGFALALFTFFNIYLYILFAILIIAAAIPAMYSYVLYRKNI
ncbi:MAG: SdpI family protein [Oscillospiraceae bacterium]|nr:SdpI family protein [Oscillospiraceae bacterium]